MTVAARVKGGTCPFKGVQMATGQTAPVQVFPRQLAPRQISTRTSVLTGQMAPGQVYPRQLAPGHVLVHQHLPVKYLFWPIHYKCCTQYSLLIFTNTYVYNFKKHVASDVGVDQLYIPASSYETQKHLDFISKWTSVQLYDIFQKQDSIFNKTHHQ